MCDERMTGVRDATIGRGNEKRPGTDRTHRVAQLLAAIEIGPTRTLQQHIEFGVVQIVDIALRALSPAVNDPTTAISCVDHLSTILIFWAGRMPAARSLLESTQRRPSPSAMDQL